MNEEGRPEETGSMGSLLSSAYHDRAPSEALETRVMDEFAARQGPRPGPRAWFLAAAAVVIFFLGAFSTRLGGPRDRLPAARFMMVLYDPPGWGDRTPVERQATVLEYAEWAGREAEAGRYVTGEHLLDPVEWVNPGENVEGEPTADHAIGGFFIIGADSLEEAVAVAERHPHNTHGGWIQVRPVGEH